jgi:hypothetical protein
MYDTHNRLYRAESCFLENSYMLVRICNICRLGLLENMLVRCYELIFIEYNYFKEKESTEGGIPVKFY